MFQLIKRTLFAGTLAIVPIALTFWILRFLFNFLDGFASPFLKKNWYRNSWTRNNSNPFIYFFIRVIYYECSWENNF